MRRHASTTLAFALISLLAGCGDLPRPFEGRPGALGARLAQPPPARLAIAPPTQAMLTDIGADTLAGALADALVAREVPAVADAPHRGDWSLALSAELRDGKVVPSYEVDDPAGKAAGTAQGQPVDPAAWSDASPETLRAAAASAAPSIATLLANIDAARRQSDPNSLVNRPARVVVIPVSGAPGDGDSQLTRQMRLELPKLGETVQDTATNADFSVAGKVVVVPESPATQRVEIQWVVADATGEERGRIVQLNEVPTGTLNTLWGDVALVVAHEAAGGVKDVILNQTGARR
jgi:hypothetical protein